MPYCIMTAMHNFQNIVKMFYSSHDLKTLSTQILLFLQPSQGKLGKPCTMQNMVNTAEYQTAHLI